MKRIIYVFLFFSYHFAFSQQTQLWVKVANGNDDVEISTQFYTGSSDLELGGFDSDNSGKQYVVIPFQNIALPTNAQISKAYIQFMTKSPQPQTTSITIKCQQGNATAFVATENLLLRTYIPSIVTWNPPAWTVLNESTAKQQTADLSAQINTAIAANWQSGNALSFIFQGRYLWHRCE